MQNETSALPDVTPIKSFRQDIPGGPVDSVFQPYTVPTYLTGSLTDGFTGDNTSGIGALITPDSGYSLERLDHYEVFGIDNCVFGGTFDPNRFDDLLRRVSEGGYHTTALFAVAPDVFDRTTMRGDARATIERSRPWFARIRAYGIPAAFVAQDGLELIQDEIPWSEFDVLFMGGSDEFKLGRKNPEAWHRMIETAKGLGKRIHVGRVNSEKRYRWAMSIGAASVDGTYLAFGPKINTPKLVGWIDRAIAETGMSKWIKQGVLFT